MISVVEPVAARVPQPHEQRHRPRVGRAERRRESLERADLVDRVDEIERAGADELARAVAEHRLRRRARVRQRPRRVDHRDEVGRDPDERGEQSVRVGRSRPVFAGRQRVRSTDELLRASRPAKSSSAAGRAGLQSQPWNESHPSWSRRASCADRSTPSATTRSLSEPARLMMARTMASLLSSSSRPLHERAVDLQHLDRERLEVRERRVAGAEVVDDEVHAEGRAARRRSAPRSARRPSTRSR